MLTNMVTTNQFNAFCIDCQKNRSTHANITYGVFICHECADFLNKNMAQPQAYIKSLFTEVWDPYQLTIAQIGGNQKFYEFLQPYNKEKLSIMEKYNSSACKWYAKKIAFEAKGIEFKETQPAHNM